MPAELLGYLADYETILIPDRYSVVELLTNFGFLVERSLGLLAAVGLILFKPWGRPVLLVCLAMELILTVIMGPYVTTGWTAFVGYLYSLVEGAIVALVYFSPVRELFETREDR